MISAYYANSHAHDVLTAFMSKHGFEVTKHYHLETAWRATFSHGEGGRTIGVNSEVGVSRTSLQLVTGFLCQMDALPGIGHACGHNLIAIGGRCCWICYVMT
jgi:metal-dependent amidase/aminoacylase/carboxypeptidase family protein